MISLSRKKSPQGVEILSIEAKDLWLANNTRPVNEVGYNPRYAHGESIGKLKLSKFINTFDYSLDFIYWNKIRGRHIKKKPEPMYYYADGRTSSKVNHRYTLDFINVTYNYSVKEFNKKSSTLYTKVGYSYIDDSYMNDSVCVINGELIAIELQKKVECPLDQEILLPYFAYDEENGKYIQIRDPKTVLSTRELRQWTYSNGFICDNKRYVRWKRSSGSSRIGKCLFIDERLYEPMHKYEMCGIKIEENDKTDLASLEAYISLTLSSIIDTIDIDPTSILVIPDYESVFSEECIDTRSDNGHLVTDKRMVEIKNSIFDGQSLLDKSVFGVYENYGMLLLRNRFFKSCCFNANIQEWFVDNNIIDINQLNGITFATDIKQIKMITTPSSIKYAKFGSIKTWLKRIGTTFGVVKHEKPTSFLNGKLVHTHYQLLNTLQMSEKEVAEFMKESFDYLSYLKNDIAVLRHHIRYNLLGNKIYEPFLTNNDIVYTLLGLNDDIAKTKIYEKFKKDIYDSYIKDLRSGKVLVNGNYEVLCGNPIEMLRHSVNLFNGEPYMVKNTISTSRFEYGKELLGSRSPHVCASCILITTNTQYSEIDKYMNGTNEIVYINSINENILQRLSGAD